MFNTIIVLIMANLIIILITYIIVNTNYMKVKFLEEEANRGDARNKYVASVMLLQGLGIKKDEKKGLKYLKMAAEEGDAQAQYLYAGELIRNCVTDHQEDFDKAKEDLLKTAEGGFFESILSVSKLYDVSVSFKEELEKSLSWFKTAAQKGHLESQMNIAHYLSKQDDANNKIEAYAWYEVASANGDKTASSYSLDLFNSFSKEEQTQASELAKEYLTKYVNKKENI